ncbi:MAG: sigma-54 dependent transcriptional regulator [Burkholderiales bacterium]
MNAREPPRLCLIEDDSIMGESLCDRFRLEGFAVEWQRDAQSARRSIESRAYAAVISDILLPDGTGEQLFRELLALGRPLPPFVFITGYGTVDGAVALLKLGAADYVTKPFDLEQLVAKVRTLSAASCQAQDRDLGVSPAMRSIEAQLPRIAAQAATLLISGESGVGKERIARAFHELAYGDAEKPFVAVNCGAVAESLMESELFGHERGAFTGAIRARRGYFEQADRGTLFLDEIGDMPLAMQSKLLRAIQEHSIVRVGGERTVAVQFRLVLATHRDLKKLVESGQFREDLYYRVNVIHVRVPPLRERREDVLCFAQRFLREWLQAHPGEQRHLHPLTERALLTYPWPGNVRELKHCIERACILSRTAMILPEICFDASVNPQTAETAIRGNLGEYLHECERRYIAAELERQGWQMTRTAEMLGISRKNLWEKMRKLGVSEPDAPAAD